MARKRGRPKKLPALRLKEFDRQFREARLAALLVDKELTVLYANDYARDTLPEAEQPGGLLAMLPEDLRQECLRRIEEGESFRLALPSGASIAVTPMTEEEGDQAAGAMVLVVGGDRPGEEIASGDGVSAISNSMRQPLASIFASLSVMGRTTHIVGSGDNQRDRYLDNINLAAYKLLRNVNNLVSYQYICSGGRGPVEVVDFWERLAPIMDACDIILHDSEIPFRFELPEKPYVANVSCCFAEVVDALMNLISNAFRHSRPGNRVEVTGRNIKNGVVVTVSDLGRGIKPEHLDKIFSPFYSMGQDEEAYVGMGMGLTVARQNILINGGSLAVDSTFGKGTSVAFTLPTCDRPVTPPLVMAASAAQYLQDRFSRIYIGLCDVATPPAQ